MTARGAGYGYVGGCVPVRGGIALSLARMNRIKEIHFADAVAVVEPGVITGVLQAAAREQKLFYPPDPGEPEGLQPRRKHRDECRRAALPEVRRHAPLRARARSRARQWRVLRTGGRTHKNKTGFDLIGLFVGSEGLLGVVTETTLRLLPLPPARATLSASFAPFGSGRRGAGDFCRRLSCLRARDRRRLHARSRGRDHGAAIAPDGNAHLLVDLDGQRESVRREDGRAARPCSRRESRTRSTSRRLRKVAKSSGRCGASSAIAARHRPDEAE